MWTSAALYHLLHLLHFTVDIRNVCVLLAPFMAAANAVATYLLTQECWNSSAAIYSAAFVAIAPGYISRSVAGSYDNEAVAIFALVLTFYTWVKAVKSGSMLWGSITALAYFYMVASWGGYIFIINLLPAHVLVLLLCGRYTHRLYVAYCTFYVLATLLSMQIMFVGFQPVSSPEHLLSFGVFALLQLYNAYYWLHSMMTPAEFRLLGRWLGVAAAGSILALLLLAVSGTVPFLTGRLYSLLGATTNIAIVKSVSEHQPSPWTTFFFDLHCIVFLVPVGMYYCFAQMNDANLFAVIYVLFASYFAGIMVRLVLVLTPGACVLAGIGASVTMQNFADVLASPSESKLIEQAKLKLLLAKQQAEALAADAIANGADVASATAIVSSSTSTDKSLDSSTTTVRVPRVSKPVAALVLAAMSVLFFFFTIHCNWVTSTAYSSPSIVLQATGGDGSLIIFDDFRETYSWLRHNTAKVSKILSWWDYGSVIKADVN
jgi:dolichyl-diphosphooligosaccharide---protein glycosyltransferase